MISIKIKDKVVKLYNNKNDLEKHLAKIPKPNDKEQIKKQLAQINKEYHDIRPIFQKNYNKANSKFMISTETTTKEKDIYWLTSNDMINLQLITKCVGVLNVSDNSKHINQNQWNNCIKSEMGYHITTNKHLFVETEYFILLRFLDNSNLKLFYDRNDNCAIFSTKVTSKNRPYHQIMKFCDPRTKFILIGDWKHIENKMCKSFLAEKSYYFDFPPSYQPRCMILLHKREKYNNIENIKWLNINTSTIIQQNLTNKMSLFYNTYLNKIAYQFYSNQKLRVTIHPMKRMTIESANNTAYTIFIISKQHHSKQYIKIIKYQ